MVDVLLNQPDQEIFTALLSKVANRHTLPPLTRHNHLETFVEGLRCAIHCTKGQDQAQTLVSLKRRQALACVSPQPYFPHTVKLNSQEVGTHFMLMLQMRKLRLQAIK